MSDRIEVIVIVEPEFFDFENACKLAPVLARAGLGQLLHAGVINDHKIGKRTALVAGGSAAVQ
jgi:hypothetical protein